MRELQLSRSRRTSTISARRPTANTRRAHHLVLRKAISTRLTYGKIRYEHQGRTVSTINHVMLTKHLCTWPLAIGALLLAVAGLTALWSYSSPPSVDLQHYASQKTCESACDLPHQCQKYVTLVGTLWGCHLPCRTDGDCPSELRCVCEDPDVCSLRDSSHGPRNVCF